MKLERSSPEDEVPLHQDPGQLMEVPTGEPHLRNLSPWKESGWSTIYKSTAVSQVLIPLSVLLPQQGELFRGRYSALFPNPEDGGGSSPFPRTEKPLRARPRGAGAAPLPRTGAAASPPRLLLCLCRKLPGSLSAALPLLAAAGLRDGPARRAAPQPHTPLSFSPHRPPRRLSVRGDLRRGGR